MYIVGSFVWAIISFYIIQPYINLINSKYLSIEMILSYELFIENSCSVFKFVYWVWERSASRIEKLPNLTSLIR